MIKSNETVSKMQTIDETPSEFPTVSICDSNPYTTSQAQYLLEHLMQIFVSYDISSGLSQLGFYNYYLSQNDNSIKSSFYLYKFASTYTNDPSFNNSQRKSLGWDLFQVMINCTFNRIKCDLNNDFQWYFSPQYGNCYHFMEQMEQTLKIR